MTSLSRQATNPGCGSRVRAIAPRLILLGCCSWPVGVAGQLAPTDVKDLSLLVAPHLPCVWPVGMTPHAVIPQRAQGQGHRHRDLIVIDEHTGTQWDAPARFVPPPGSGLPGAGPMGLITGDKVPAWQFGGEACVIDVTRHVDDTPAGSSQGARGGYGRALAYW